MPLFKWNSIKIVGHSNLVIQDSGGNSMEIAIDEFIKRFTLEKDNQIELLQGRLADKNVIQHYTEEKIVQLTDELKKLYEERKELLQETNDLLIEFDGKDLSKSVILYQEAFSLFIDGKLDEAIEYLTESKFKQELQKLEQQEKEVIEAKKKIAATYSLKGRMLILKFDFESAIENCNKAIALDSTNPDIWLTLSSAYRSAGKLRQALECLETAISVRRSLPENYAFQALQYLNMAQILLKLDEHAKAREYLEKSLKIIKDNPELSFWGIDICLIMGHLCSIFGDKEDRLIFTQRAYDLAHEFYGNGGPLEPYSRGTELATAANDLGVLYYDLEDYNKATFYFDEALNVHKKNGNSDEEIGGNLFFNIGCTKQYLGERTEALNLMYKAIFIDSTILGENHLQLATYYHNIAPVLLEEDKYKEKAKLYLFKALAIREEAYPEIHSERAGSYAALAIVIQMAEPLLSIEYFKKAINIREKLFGYDDVEIAKWYLYLSISYIPLNRRVEHIKYSQKAWLRIKSCRELGQEYLKDFEENLSNVNIILSEEVFQTECYCKFLVNVWEGHYSYVERWDGEQFPFKLFLQATVDGVVEGTCIEYQNEIGEPQIAMVKGKYLPNTEIELKKTYLVLNGINDEDLVINEPSIVYKGLYLEQENRFVGTWTMTVETDQIKGFWEMKKSEYLTIQSS